MISKKKAELSINMIVIIAICIVILVIMVYLIIGRGEDLDQTTKCTAKGGACVSSNENCRSGATIGNYPEYCNSRNPICCELGGISR